MSEKPDYRSDGLAVVYVAVGFELPQVRGSGFCEAMWCNRTLELPLG